MNPERSEAPPGGWKYTQPESGWSVQRLTWKHLLRDVFMHRTSNGYDVAKGWEERFEKDFCEQNLLNGTCWCPSEDSEIGRAHV